MPGGPSLAVGASEAGGAEVVVPMEHAARAGAATTGAIPGRVERSTVQRIRSLVDFRDRRAAIASRSICPTPLSSSAAGISF
jgi:hypothetical protein